MTKKQLKEEWLKLRDNNMFKRLNEEDMKWVWDNIYKFHPHRTYSYEDVEWIMPSINKAQYCTKGMLVHTKDGVEDFWSVEKCLRNIKLTSKNK